MCGYRKGFGTQQTLLSSIERLKNAFDQNGYGGAILMGLSKAFDTINHLLIAKLGACGSDAASLKLIRSYLANRFQSTKVNTSFSSWSKLFLVVPQGSVLVRLLFNIYFNDLFYLTDMTEIMLTIQLSMLVTWTLKVLLLDWSMIRPLLENSLNRTI